MNFGTSQTCNVRDHSGMDSGVQFLAAAQGVVKAETLALNFNTAFMTLPLHTPPHPTYPRCLCCADA